jgi:hypothetical protein
LGLKRIVGPHDGVDTATERIVPLSQLDEPTATAILIGRYDADHVRLEVRMSTLHAAKGEGEAHHPTAVERTERLTTEVARYGKNARRHDITIAVSPGLTLKVLRLLKVLPTIGAVD